MRAEAYRRRSLGECSAHRWLRHKQLGREDVGLSLEGARGGVEPDVDGSTVDGGGVTADALADPVAKLVGEGESAPRRRVGGVQEDAALGGIEETGDRVELDLGDVQAEQILGDSLYRQRKVSTAEDGTVVLTQRVRALVAVVGGSHFRALRHAEESVDFVRLFLRGTQNTSWRGVRRDE